MQLKKIKLGGFKSFVDPTTVSFPSQLVGVVGPNGCGKSNVIDAVRWVMGESSAKHLRGDSLSDVIFNGSSSRKPVGHATIELIFDNREGRLGGQYAQYNEISVKRQLSRDGQSVYYLNGTRCRRRDITDVFLGTGLGPRSYAIIEQGTISRLIEAKPEELRVFLEEAAGISKYKERRRETENRIRDTRENLDRINDLVVELDKRLQTLQRQAKAAEKYRELKQEERLLRAQLLALRYRGLDEEIAGSERAIAGQENAVEKVVAELRSVEAGIEKQRQAQVEANEHFNRIQGEYYGLGSDIARLEQSIQHARETRQQNEKDLAEIERAYDEARQHIDHDKARIAELRATLENSEPEMREREAAEQASAAALSEAEQAMSDWQGEWEAFNARAAEQSRKCEVQRTRIQHLEGHLGRLRERLSRLEGEDQGLAADRVEQESASLNRQEAEVNDTIGTLRGELQSLAARLSGQREANARTADELDQGRNHLQALQREQASLEGLQKAALGKQETTVTEWLEEQGLSDVRRLAEAIEVESGWERAVETVLGLNLEAVCVSGLEAVADRVRELRHGTLTVFDTAAGTAATAGSLAAPLLDKVRAPWGLDSVLGGVYAADSVAEALALRPRLGAHESVVTRDGVWMGSDWLRVVNESDGKSGVLAREHELREIARSLETAGANVDELDRRRQQGNERLAELEGEREALQSRLEEATQQQAELRAQISSKNASLEQIQNRKERLQAEIDEVRSQLAQDGKDVEEARLSLDAMLADAEGQDQEREQLLHRRDELRDTLDGRRAEARADRDAARETAVRIESARSQLGALDAGLERMERQLEQLVRQRDELQKAIAGSDEPIAAMGGELEQLLSRRLEVENRLAEARRAVEDCDHALRELDEKRNAGEQRVQDERETLGQMRMAWQELKVRRQTLLEQIGETGHVLETLLTEMPEEATEESWQEQVERIDQKIQRMGAINLAAIDEYAEQSERKEYLDAQAADLNEALETLENAIRKIDNETRLRFKETFDHVNDRLKELYPKLFGGGVARLEMTSDDLLDAGVVVMARPPGKRNANIHQLSGGEKALTAVALVFALFELNPAPFCMLDEVDAPLDDANAARFCQLVREMSDRVQFIVITHNKITMELAEQLVGVTMHEPGVSRLVAVDIDEAVEMAAS